MVEQVFRQLIGELPEVALHGLTKRETRTGLHIHLVVIPIKQCFLLLLQIGKQLPLHRQQQVEAHKGIDVIPLGQGALLALQTFHHPALTGTFIGFVVLRQGGVQFLINVVELAPQVFKVFFQSAGPLQHL